MGWRGVFGRKRGGRLGKLAKGKGEAQRDGGGSGVWGGTKTHTLDLLKQTGMERGVLEGSRFDVGLLWAPEGWDGVAQRDLTLRGMRADLTEAAIASRKKRHALAGRCLQSHLCDGAVALNAQDAEGRLYGDGPTFADGLRGLLDAAFSGVSGKTRAQTSVLMTFWARRVGVVGGRVFGAFGGQER